MNLGSPHQAATPACLSCLLHQSLDSAQLPGQPTPSCMARFLALIIKQAVTLTLLADHLATLHTDQNLCTLLVLPPLPHDCRSFFACCSSVEKKHEMTKITDTIVPDPHLIHDIMEPIPSIGYCNWTMTSNAMVEVMRSSGSETTKPIVGMATAVW